MVPIHLQTDLVPQLMFLPIRSLKMPTVVSMDLIYQCRQLTLMELHYLPMVHDCNKTTAAIMLTAAVLCMMILVILLRR